MKEFWTALAHDLTLFMYQDGARLGWRHKPGDVSGLGGTHMTMEDFRDLRALLWKTETCFVETLGVEVTSRWAESKQLEWTQTDGI